MQLSKGEILSSRLVIDAMGNFSPILKQVFSYFLNELNSSLVIAVLKTIDEIYCSCYLFCYKRLKVVESQMECALLLDLVLMGLRRTHQAMLFIVVHQ